MNERLLILISIDTFEQSPVAVFDDLSALRKWVKEKEEFWGGTAIWSEYGNQVRLAGSKYYWTEIPYFETWDYPALG